MCTDFHGTNEEYFKSKFKEYTFNQTDLLNTRNSFHLLSTHTKSNANYIRKSAEVTDWYTQFIFNWRRNEKEMKNCEWTKRRRMFGASRLMHITQSMCIHSMNRRTLRVCDWVCGCAHHIKGSVKTTLIWKHTDRVNETNMWTKLTSLLSFHTRNRTLL